MTQGFESHARPVRLFRDQRDQAVRIPAEFELPGDTALMRREGGRLIIESIPPNGLLASWQPLAEDIASIDDAPSAPEDIF
ncbi:twitching motility protein PilT [Elstera litoralis]|uniref:Twitching motility protein PilT n=1 Tax=Elstera litoralis TaxID=552518 RepID=A0A0F3IR95_9PROT|nr:twitching motility protein PilT [Elstera litoralis]KJV09236.1 twitching motility protein PilT [Elstera litoralis]